MALKYRVVLLLVLSAFLAVTPGFAYDEPDRTVNRTPEGIPDYKKGLFVRPDHYEFSPAVSNTDVLTQHPDQWDGQDWDPSKWGPGWTPEIVLKKFFKARIFERRFMNYHTPAVELGPTFYQLSDLDQRRSLKLLIDQANIFGQGYRAVDLVDWSTHDVIGIYTAKGMFLN
jgi:hypothetical protein